jgi:hypothetical protein
VRLCCGEPRAPKNDRFHTLQVLETRGTYLSERCLRGDLRPLRFLHATLSSIIVACLQRQVSFQFEGRRARNLKHRPRSMARSASRLLLVAFVCKVGLFVGQASANTDVSSCSPWKDPTPYNNNTIEARDIFSGVLDTRQTCPSGSRMCLCTSSPHPRGLSDQTAAYAPFPQPLADVAQAHQTRAVMMAPASFGAGIPAARAAAPV